MCSHKLELTYRFYPLWYCFPIENCEILHGGRYTPLPLLNRVKKLLKIVNDGYRMFILVIREEMMNVIWALSFLIKKKSVRNMSILDFTHIFEIVAK